QDLQTLLQRLDRGGAGAGRLVAGHLADGGRDVVGRPVDGLGHRAVRVVQVGCDLVPLQPGESRRVVAGPDAQVLAAEVYERDRAGLVGRGDVRRGVVLV